MQTNIFSKLDLQPKLDIILRKVIWDDWVHADNFATLVLKVFVQLSLKIESISFLRAWIITKEPINITFKFENQTFLVQENKF